MQPIALIALASSLAAVGGCLLLVADQRARAQRLRVAQTASHYRPSRTQQASLLRTAGMQEVLAPSRLLLFLNIHSDRPDLYPMAWWGLMLLASLAAGLVGLLGNFLIGAASWLGVPLVWIVLNRMLFGRFLAKRTNALYMQMPDAMGMIVRSVRVGINVQDALRIVADDSQWPTSLEFRQLDDELRLGATMGDALTRLATRSGLVEYRFFAVALTLQNQAGGSLSETLDGLADLVRKRVALRARGLALAAEARLSMYVLAALPFFCSGALLLIQPDYLLVLVTTPMGKSMLFAGIVLLILGMTAMQAIIKKNLS